MTLLVAVPPNLPGLVASINPAVRVGGASKIFSFAWLFGVSPNLTLLVFTFSLQLHVVCHISGRVLITLFGVPGQRDVRGEQRKR